MILLFLRWLELVGIARDRLVFRVAIHESADVEWASLFWSRVIGIPVDRFSRPSLKRHNPETVRKNIGSDYVGCLTIDVCRSADLLRRITGWYEGMIRSMGPGVNVASISDFDSEGSGSTPEGPAIPSTLFERHIAYSCRIAT